ncbi:SIR2 family protein [Roseivirga pacifica]|nr:SIR2 family protein [Roseivirga pacifica]
MDRDKMFQEVFDMKLSKGKYVDIDQVTGDRINTPYKESRNILIIGAGASQNAFTDLLLAKDAQEEILESIIVADGITKEVEGKVLKIDTPISLRYFLEFYENWKRGNDKEKGRLLKVTSGIKNEDLNQYLTEQLLNQKSYLYGLGEKYYSELRKSRLLKSQYDRSTKIDFETSLSILSKILPLQDVRKAVKDIYDKAEGPTLFYHIVAHLFKHRFIDVIINFNFDELLDRVLDEELTRGGYDRIIADGDCRPKKDLVKENRLRQPLYIKPHGTVSHKSSLRFTKDQYHELPIDMRDMIRDLLDTKDETPEKRINLITVGFELKSIEFNELFNETLSTDCQVFTFFWHNEKQPDTNLKTMLKNKMLDLVRVFSPEDDLDSNLSKLEKYCPVWIPIAHESALLNKSEFQSVKIDHLNKYYSSLDNTFLFLFDCISDAFNKEFKPRGIYRHLLIAKLFGNHVFRAIANSPDKKIGSWEERFSRQKLPSYFNESSYFRDRTLVEILLTATMNHGRIDPYIMMDGQTGQFYSRYFEKSSSADTFSYLLEKLEMYSDNESDKFGIREIPINHSEKKEIESVIEEIVIKYMNKKGLFSPTLEAYFEYIQNDNFEDSGACLKSIIDTFVQLFFSDNSKIQSSLRDTKYHIFESYRETDLLTTELSNNLTYLIALKDKKVNRICAIADYGLRIAKFLERIKSYNPETFIYLIAQENIDTESIIKNPELIGFNKAKGFKKEDLMKAIYDKQYDITVRNYKKHNSDFFAETSNIYWFQRHFRIIYSPITNHNHHSCFFLRGDSEKLDENSFKNINTAIYYYKWGLSQQIDPIYFTEPSNIKFVTELFEKASEDIFNVKDSINEHKMKEWIC